MSAPVLPSKLSELTELALWTLAWVEAKPHVYVVDMGWWHTLSPNDARCHVCLAGSVMAATYGLEPSEFSNPAYFAQPHRGKLLALDSIRCGNVSEAAERAWLSGAEQLRAASLNRPISNYVPGDGFFRSDLERLVSDLKQAQL